MKIGLLGYGTVGKGVYDIVADMENMEIAKVLCLGNTDLADGKRAKNFDEILEDKTIDTIVEVMGGLSPAWEYTKAAIAAGKDVVTANKALVNHYYSQIITLTQQYGTRFRCTAAVGGGIGWLNELERAKQADTIYKISGIMNGTCNYILYNMTENNLDYADVLKQAQALGYAEADPSADVDGIDTWNKLVISANIAFDADIDRHTVPVCGISNISACDIEQFTNHGYVCKLVGTAQKQDGRVSAYVQPTLVKKDSLAAAVPANYNLITMTGKNAGTRSLYGQGAGRYPTAFNVVCDCADIQTGKGFYTDKAEQCTAQNKTELQFYIRGGDKWINSIAQQNWNGAVVTKPVPVESIHNWLKQNPSAFAAAIEE